MRCQTINLRSPLWKHKQDICVEQKKLIQLCVNWAWIVVKSPLSANDKPVARPIQECVSREDISRDW